MANEKEYYCPRELTYKTIEEARTCQFFSGKGCDESVDDSGLCNVVLLNDELRLEDN